jgi:hypothetical protein
MKVPMPRELLLALDADVHRLLGSGISAAAQDAGLQRQARTLRTRAGQTQALKPLSDRLSRVLAGDAEGPRVLLDLLVLMAQVRASFAQSGGQGSLEPVSLSGPWSTTAPASDLPRLVRWLRRPSWEDNSKDVRRFLLGHSDLRLVDLLLHQFEGGSGEVADLIGEQIDPAAGSALVAGLVPLLERGDRKSQARVLRALCRIDGRRGAELCRSRLDNADAKVRTDALRGLTVASSEEAKRTALAWLQGRPPRPLREAAWECLYQVRPARVSDLPALLMALPQARDDWAPRVVASVGRPAVRPLIEMLRSPDGNTRDGAVSALRYLGAKAAPAVPQLIELLTDADEDLVTSVLWTLSEIGPAARAAVPQVIDLLTTYKTEAGIGYSAANTLAKIGSEDPGAIAALISRLDSKHPDVVFNAVSRLAEIGPAARAAVPRLVARYSDKRSDWEMRIHILEALSAFGRAAAEARSFLEKVLSDRDSRFRYRAALALGLIGLAGKAAVPVLLEAMHDTRDTWWWKNHAEEALRALAAIGPAATAAVPDLIAMARTESSERRRRTVQEVLKRIRPKQ